MKRTISVIMGIYNCEAYLPAAIDSLLAQTVDDWELIMCDDGSTDGTLAAAEDYVRRWPDRMTLLKNESNMGLNHTLNECLARASGKYIARQDGDDVSLPQRFEKEFAVLESEPDIAIVSTAMEYFDAGGVWGRCAVIPRPEKRDFLHGTPFCHAPCLVRREAYEAVGGYTESPELLRVEDYHLWMKMYAAGFRGVNLAEPLYRMRDDRNAFSRRRFKYRVNEFRVRALAVRTLGLPRTGYIFALRAILVGLLPPWAYRALHRRRLAAINDKAEE